MLATWSRYVCLAETLLLVAGGAPAGADESVCRSQSVGLVACIAGRLCSCRFEHASYASGLPDGFRWDCGILRPSCGDPPPATIDAWQGGLPDSLDIDQSRTIIKEGSGKQKGWPHH